jgi:beta-lactamase superfamily II metal-dependent hydrolase
VKCEIEFMPVGEGETGGDCILVRYGEEDAFELMVVDGGTLESGEALVEHIQKHFPGHTVIEHVVLTHADKDHASGLRALFGQFEIHHLWMNVPWLLARESLPWFADDMTPDDAERKVRNEYDILAEIWDLACEHDIPIYLALQGEQIGPFTVLSPSRDAYVRLLPQFERTPDPDQQALEAEGMWIAKGKTGILAKALEALRSAFETYSIETLRDNQKTSASNESSVVMYAQTDTGNKLLTGDAGLRALEWAADEADQRGLPLQNFTFVQIPHHGSRHNVGPTILNRIIGYPISEAEKHGLSAFVSVPKDDTKHPRKVVLNAFIRRGARVYPTKGVGKIHWGGFKPRSGYDSVDPTTFSNVVEAYDDD